MTAGLLVTFAFLLALKAVNSHSVEVECRLGGQRFDVGDSWHPEVPPFGTMQCINCTCGQSGAVTCESQTCPKLRCRRTTILPTECCPVCAKNLPAPTVDNLVPMPEPTNPPRESCSHDKERYQHSQIFSTKKSGLRKTKENQCVLCICLDGDVLCHLKTCQNVTCSNPYYAQDDCCPRCPGQQPVDHWKESQSNSNGLQPEAAGPSKEHCIENGIVRYADGSTWHPVIGPFGSMRCVICSCKGGEVRCRRKQCIPDDALPCSQATRETGQCCPSCEATNSTDITPHNSDPSLSTNLLCALDHRHDILVAKVTTRRRVMLFVTGENSFVYNWFIDRGKIVRMERIDLTEEEAGEIVKQLQLATEDAKLGVIKHKLVAKWQRKAVRFAKKCDREECNRQQLMKMLKKFKFRTCSI